MEAWFLREWQRTGLWQIGLRPVSWLFGLLVATRRLLFRAGWIGSERIDVPVIVVGNITVGGTGKTPLVLALAAILAGAGLKPGIITRGYRRESASGDAQHIVHVTNPKNGETFSDEAVLLANRSGVPVYAGANRADVARALRKAHPEINVIISDDGLQHYRLQRDIELCVIDGSRGLGNGALLPAGPLREPSSRLTDVDAIVVNGGNVTAHPAANAPAFTMVLAKESFVPLRGGESLAKAVWLARFGGKKIAVIAGTGNPARFFSHVAGLGIEASKTLVFPDHHPFVEADLNAIDAEIILMTEKDAVKCALFADDRMWFMRVDAVLPDAFGEFVLARLEHLKANLKA
jgi:tetraacyldisaccharide 4'-kinase